LFCCRSDCTDDDYQYNRYVFTARRYASAVLSVGNESVPIQLAQCRFPGLAISSAKILIYFSNKIYGSNFIKQHSETVVV